MRYRLMATYRGVAYEAGVGPTDKDVVLFAALPPPEELGFQPATGHWRKAVSRAEVDAVWESRPSGVFRGEPCLVLDDLGEQLHISYLGYHPSRAERLGYSQLEPGVFELVAAREDVTDITEDRVDHPFLPWHQTWPPFPAGPGPAGYPDHGAAASYPEPGPAPRPGPTPQPGRDPYPEPDARPGRDPYPEPAVTEPFAAAAAAAVPLEASSGAAGLLPRRATRHSRAGSGPLRAQTRQIFAELIDLAAIPQHAYAVDEAVDGAVCLVSTEAGFEVFSAAGGIRQEVRLFGDEETAYFYVFGLLAAEAVRDGRLVPPSR